jgi:hypothetical protein
MQQMSSPPQFPARIAAFAALSDDDLINTAMEMPPEEFEEFLSPAELKALVVMPSGAVPADPGPRLFVPPNVPLPPATKHRESSEPGMSEAWSRSEVKVLVDAVDRMKSTGCCALDWKSIRDTLLPHRTAAAIEKRYYLYVRDIDNSDDDDAADADVADLEYFKSFREWLRAPLTVDLIYAAATFRRPQTLQVRM